MDPLYTEIALAWAPYVALLVVAVVTLCRRYRTWWQRALILLPAAALVAFVYIEIALSLVFRSLFRALFG